MLREPDGSTMTRPGAGEFRTLFDLVNEEDRRAADQR